MEIETKIITIRHRYILVRVAKKSFLTDAKYCEGFGESSTLIHCWWECQLEYLFVNLFRIIKFTNV